MPVKTLQELGFDPNSGVMLGDIGTGAGAFPQPPVMNFIDQQNAQRRQALTPLVTRGSWYSQLPGRGWVDRADRPGSNALGVPDAMQGIALPSRAGLGKWFNVTSPTGESYRLQQTDVGPAKWTGRGVDISAAAADRMGYTPKTFPTDARFTVVPAEGPPPGWEANVAAASNPGGVGYTNPASAGQGAITNPAELVRKDEPTLGSRLMNALANFDFTPVKPAKAAPLGFAEGKPFQFTPVGQRRGR